MPAPEVEKLLHAQECDVHYDQIRRQLESFPMERAALEEQIEAHRASVAAAREHLQKCELARKDLEGRIAAEEEKVRKYRTQQLSVKKNEEYRAFEHEISGCTERIDSLESEEIEVLIQIDGAKEALGEAESEAETQIGALERHIERLHALEADSRRELADAEQRAAAAAEALAPATLESYRYVRGRVRKPPYVAALVDKQCQGCFLRVSTEIESEARRGGGIARCDSCGRLVYL